MRRQAVLAAALVLAGQSAGAEEVRTLWLLSEGGAPIPAARVRFEAGPEGPRFRIDWDGARFRALPGPGGSMALPCLQGPEEVWCRLPAPRSGPATAEGLSAAIRFLRRPAAEPDDPGRVETFAIVLRRGRWHGRITDPGSDAGGEPWLSALEIE